MPPKPIRLVHFPSKRMENPYLQLFYDALEPHGIRSSGEFELSPAWLWRSRDSVDVLHFHWVEYLWRPDSRKALARLLGLLLLAKSLGVVVVWTVHNIEPHRGAGRADRAGFRLMSLFADVLICHSPSASDAARESLRPRGRVVVMNHGNYHGWYPEPRDRETVLRGLGLDPARPVISSIGHIRRYKGLETACQAAHSLGEEAQLLIAGAPDWGYDLAALQDAMDGLPSAALVARSLTDQEVADLVHASDLLILPYTRITGSGALLMAWTLGRAVVASDLQYFRELIPAGSRAGWLFEPGNPAALAVAVGEALSVPGKARSIAASEEAGRYGWEECVRPVVQAITASRGC